MTEHFTKDVPFAYRVEFRIRVQNAVDTIHKLITENLNEPDPSVTMSALASMLASMMHSGLKENAFNKRFLKKMLISLYSEALKGPPEDQH